MLWRSDKRIRRAPISPPWNLILRSFRSSLRDCRGHIFGESFGRIFAGGLVPILVEPHTGSAVIFFGVILVVVGIGAFIPILFGRETVGQLEVITETVPAFA
jgi:hypothetical protein